MGLRGIGSKSLSARDIDQEPMAEVCLAWQEGRKNRAQRVIAFIESLDITAGAFAGTKFNLRPWQKRIIRAIYREGGGQRLIRTVLITVPRKNGKTQLAAALALAHLSGPEAESRGQIYSAASDRDQAALIFREMVAMIDLNAFLVNRINVVRTQKRLEDLVNGTVYQALSSDARKAHGLSPSVVICDELAQWHGRELYDNLTTATGARKEPLTVVISTQSSDPNHIMSELSHYARQVRDGVIEDATFLPIVYEAAQDADAWSERVWRKCNPALGDFRSLEEMRVFAKQAKRLPAKEAAFRNLYLNQPVDAEQRFISSADWEACGAPVSAESLDGAPCWAGLDLGSTTDLTALVLYFPHDAGAVLPFFWVPGERLVEREERDHVPYQLWRRQGFIEANDGRAVDRHAIVFRLAEIAGRFDVRGIAYDRWRMEDLQKILSDEGIELPLVPWGQGYRDMGPAVDAMEAAILDQNLAHGGHPVLTWNAANAVVTLDPAGSRKIAKDKSIERVDGLVALAMAIGLHSRQAVDAPRSYLETGELVVLNA